MADKTNRERIKSFLASHKLAVIATNSSTGKAPGSALIAYVEDGKVNLYFQTGKYTRKAKNLKTNPNVSFVIGHNLEGLATLQYEGIAAQLKSPSDIKSCKQRFLDKQSPTTKEYLERPDAIFFKVTPEWISFSDYSRSGHPTVIQLDF